MKHAAHPTHSISSPHAVLRSLALAIILCLLLIASPGAAQEMTVVSERIEDSPLLLETLTSLPYAFDGETAQAKSGWYNLLDAVEPPQGVFIWDDAAQQVLFGTNWTALGEDCEIVFRTRYPDDVPIENPMDDERFMFIDLTMKRDARSGPFAISQSYLQPYSDLTLHQAILSQMEFADLFYIETFYSGNKRLHLGMTVHASTCELTALQLSVVQSDERTEYCWEKRTEDTTVFTYSHFDFGVPMIEIEYLNGTQIGHTLSFEPDEQTVIRVQYSPNGQITGAHASIYPDNGDYRDANWSIEEYAWYTDDIIVLELPSLLDERFASPLLSQE